MHRRGPPLTGIMWGTRSKLGELRRAVGNLGKGRRADPLESGAGWPGVSNRWRRRRKALVRRGARELLNDVAEVVLVDVVDRRLLRLGLGLGLTQIVWIRVKNWSGGGGRRERLSNGLSDLVGILVDLFEKHISIAAAVAIAVRYCSRRNGNNGVIAQAFIHLQHIHNSLSLSL